MTESSESKDKDRVSGETPSSVTSSETSGDSQVAVEDDRTTVKNVSNFLL